MLYHTKGPWEAKTSKYSMDTLIVQAGLPSMRVLASFDGDGDGYDEIDEANAALIAAAPDLLEFVQQIFNGIDTGMITIDTPADETLANILSRGRKALSKATGAS